MTSNSKIFCDKLAALDVNEYLSSGAFGKSDLELALYDLSDMMEGENVEDVIEDIFGFYERNPEIEIGVSGPLVNLIERSGVDYVPALVASLKSKPTFVTLNVLARAINSDIDDKDKTLFIDIIDTVANDAGANKFAIATAKEYLEHRALHWGEAQADI
jgi:hypothetical protein